MNQTQTKRGIFAIVWAVLAIIELDRLMGLQQGDATQKVKIIVLLVLSFGLAVFYAVSWWTNRKHIDELPTGKDQHVS